MSLPAVGSAILFNLDATSGGTDIVAMILKKYTALNIGNALLCSDCVITLAAARPSAWKRACSPSWGWS